LALRPAQSLEDLGPPVPLATVLWLFGAALVGAAGAAVLLPAWAPALAVSLGGGEPKAAWFLSRASGMVAYLLTWASMVLGLLLGTRLAKAWPGPQAAFALHQHTSLLGLAFALFHALVLLGDGFLKPSLLALAVPFAVPHAAQVWIGVGQVSLLMALPVASSFWARARLGHRGWKLIHFASFAVFALALVHGAAAGSDAGRGWVQGLYFVTGGSVLFLSLARVLGALLAAKPGGRAPVAPPIRR
jgi:predicted ferric reductase